MAGPESENQDLITVTQNSGVAVITINRPKSLNSLTRAMMVSLAHIIRRLDADSTVAVIILTGAGTRAFCSGVDLTAAEDFFKGDMKDVLSNPVAQLEACSKPIIGAINGHAVTVGFGIALACDILVAAKDAKFVDTHAKLGIFPSWGLSQKLSRIIGPMRAREVSLTAMPVTADMAERWGLVNHVVEQSSQALLKAQEIADAIIKNNRDLVPKYKAVVNDGFLVDFASVLSLEKERAHSYYDGMTKGGQSSVVPTSPVTEVEIRKFIFSRLTITPHELVGQFKSRLRNADDKKAFTEVLKRISKIQKNPSGAAYVVLK